MTRPFDTVSVIGLGTTGSALAALCSASGLRVDTVERNSEALRHGRARVRAAVAALGLSESDTADALGRINYSTGTTLLARADLVVEAVQERMGPKVALLHEANVRCPASTVFVTTTTGLAVTEIASLSGRMTRTVGLHLCHPDGLAGGTSAEVVLTPVTDAPVRDAVTEFVRRLGKTAVCVADHPGLLGAGLHLGYLNSAAAMCEQNYASGLAYRTPALRCGRRCPAVSPCQGDHVRRLCRNLSLRVRRQGRRRGGGRHARLRGGPLPG